MCRQTRIQLSGVIGSTIGIDIVNTDLFKLRRYVVGPSKASHSRMPERQEGWKLFKDRRKVDRATSDESSHVKVKNASAQDIRHVSRSRT